MDQPQTHHEKASTISPTVIWVLGIIAAVSVAIVVTLIVVLNPLRANPFNKELQSQVTFPIYYPATLPKGFTVDTSSLKTTSGILTYSIKYQGNKNLAVTVQALPKGFDTSILSGTQEFTTDYGKAYIEDLELRTTGSLVTERTWVIINAPEKAGTDNLRTIISGLRPIKSN